MTRHHLTPRPARLAIAAFLAFGSTSVLAQEVVVPPLVTTPAAPSAVQASPATPPAAAPVAAPAVPAFSLGSPVVQATPSVEESKAAAIAASEAEASARTAPSTPKITTPQAAARPVSAVERPVSRAVAPVAATPAPVAPPQASIAPTPPTAQIEAAPAPAAQQPMASSNANPALYWALGGGALILLGLGGTALVRRRRRDDLYEPVVMTEAPISKPPMTESVVAMPAPAPAPAYMAPAKAPTHAMTMDEDLLEEMAAAPPSPENPFLTHAKRLRRARFILEQGSVTPPSATPFAPASVAQQPVDRSQTVYSFGKGGSGRPTFLKPRTR